jgi:ketosteroid isomerase-like protein
MISNQELITHFYTCFQNKDYKGMQACYADNATFSDEVFINLNAKEVKAMWEMLIKTGKDLKLEFTNVSADEKNGKVHWDAYYTFSKSGNKVINRIDTHFTFENGKIVKHIDSFSFYAWSKQALGFPGLLLGWTPFLKNKIRTVAMKNLQDFMNQSHS